jgi:guanine nucleotide-binding protein subunit alpha
MGNIKSTLRSQDDNAVMSRKIDKQIKTDQKRMKKEVKLLLLGIHSLLHLDVKTNS